jgi:hypothetical protein
MISVLHFIPERRKKMTQEVEKSLTKIPFPVYKIQRVTLQMLEEIENKFGWKFVILKERAPYWSIEGQFGQMAQIFDDGEVSVLS